LVDVLAVKLVFLRADFIVNEKLNNVNNIFDLDKVYNIFKAKITLILSIFII